MGLSRCDMKHCEAEITKLLSEWGAGDESAPERLFPLVYSELHLRAKRLFWKEPQDHTLQPTAVVNEGYLRLVGEDISKWQGRSHFFGVATRAMRQALVDHGRMKRAEKRGGGLKPRPLESADRFLVPANGFDLTALFDALQELQRMDSRQATIVHLRFFAGLTVEETAQALDCSVATVNREWKTARIWLRLQLDHEQGPT